MYHGDSEDDEQQDKFDKLREKAHKLKIQKQKSKKKGAPVKANNSTEFSEDNALLSSSPAKEKEHENEISMN